MHTEVLNWVNEIRERYGLGEPLIELPKGYCGNARSCPLARAIGISNESCVGVDRLSFFLNDGRFVQITLPQPVSNFRADFDARRIPELIA